VQYLQAQGHVISFNVTVSMYNILTFSQLLEFFDSEFPNVLVHAQLAESKNDILSALNFPNRQMVLERLLPIQQFNCYKNDRLLGSFVDGLISHYQNTTFNADKLGAFFDYNDQLDRSRSCYLKDYIPELEEYR
jgi:hypothetical protein